MKTTADPQFPGALVVSLDFELHWGVRDKHPEPDRYAANLLGARTLIPRLLELFEEYEVAATWAIVGFLFATSRQDLERLAPRVLPRYANPALSPYAQRIGLNEEADPLHFAPSLIERIRRTPRQEIGTHTFSHYYCRELGQTRETFWADLQAACAAAAESEIVLRSIVFPRNQHEAAYDDVLLQHGIRAYRGNPCAWMWTFGSTEESARRRRRVGRLLDAYLNLSGDGTVAWSKVLQPSGLSDVRAGFLLRPYDHRFRHLERLRLERLRRSIRAAARFRRILHLWWHPHNFGVNQEQNLGFLRSLLEELRECRDRYGLLSLSMADVDRRVRPDNAKLAAPAAGNFAASTVMP